jgi:hypothetical protein
MSPIEHPELVAQVEGQIERYGQDALVSALTTAGLQFKLLAALNIKVLGKGDQISLEPADAWVRVRTNAGAISYRVIGDGTRNNGPRVEIKHPDGTSQRHPEKGKYKIGDVVMMDGNVIHFPN